MAEHPPPRRALVIQHEPDCLPGWVGERAEQRGIELVPLCTPPDVVFPEPTDFDLIISLGSTESVYDTGVPWIPREMATLERAVARQVPVLGICFGAQILAHVLGGDVRPSPKPELGWYEVETSDPELVPAGPWLESHFDVFTSPPEATEIARNPAGSQAFTFGPHLGVQFHPEITSEILGLWAERWKQLFPERLVRAGVDLPALEAETRRRMAQTRAAAHRFFDAFYQRAFEHRRPPAGQAARARPHRRIEHEGEPPWRG